MNEAHPPSWPTIVAMLSAALSLVLGWLHLNRRAEVADMKGDIQKVDAEAENVRRDLEKHKLFAAESFALKRDVKDELAAMEARLGLKLDEQKELLREIRTQTRN